MEIIKERTKEFKIPIGYHFKDDKRDLVISDRKRKGSFKYYKYRCICGFDGGEHYRNGELIKEYWIQENHLLNNRGCPCCCDSPQIVVPHINSIVAKEETKWMIEYFIDKEEAKKYTPSSGKSIFMKCPYCSKITDSKKNIDNLYNQKRIKCTCGDGYSYPEKFIYSMLNQLNVEFTTQLSKTSFSWCDKHRYDFYIPSLDCIIETHGIQHYLKSFNKEDVLKTQENDRFKKALALSNGIKHYIELDCRHSSIDWIKNSILNSEIVKILDVINIDWLKCEEFALDTLVKEVSIYWNDKNINETTSDLESIFGLKRNAIIDYLKRGTKLGWCNYNPKEESHLSGGSVGKKIEIFKDGISLGIFRSATELSAQSEKLFNVKLNDSNISMVCNNKRKHHKGFTFKYVDTNKEEIA